MCFNSYCLGLLFERISGWVKCPRLHSENTTGRTRPYHSHLRLAGMRSPSNVVRDPFCFSMAHVPYRGPYDQNIAVRSNNNSDASPSCRWIEATTYKRQYSIYMNTSRPSRRNFGMYVYRVLQVVYAWSLRQEIMGMLYGRTVGNVFYLTMWYRIVSTTHDDFGRVNYGWSLSAAGELCRAALVYVRACSLYRRTLAATKWGGPEKWKLLQPFHGETIIVMSIPRYGSQQSPQYGNTTSRRPNAKSKTRSRAN